MFSEETWAGIGYPFFGGLLIWIEPCRAEKGRYPMPEQFR
jgi:hypothetical protein